MTAGGWIFMFVSLAIVWSLVGWCYYKVFTSPKEPDGRTENQRK
jgi:uncharacterized membrane protein